MLTLIGIFCFFFTIMLWAPMAYDDFDFIARSSYPISDIFQYSLHYGNGRLLGNMGVVILLKSSIFCALAKAFYNHINYCSNSQGAGDAQQLGAVHDIYTSLCSGPRIVFTDIYMDKWISELCPSGPA